MNRISARTRTASIALIAGSMIAVTSMSGAAVALAQPAPPAVSATVEEFVPVSAEEVASLNASLAEQGRNPLPAGTAGFQISDDATVTIVDETGNVLDRQPTPTGPQARGVTDEIKRVVGACLGIDFFGAVGAWEAIESQVNSWDKAAKFVLRRVGLIAALSCGGGIFAEYLL
ncbi:MULTISPECIES: hypothetical protein [unclassified Rhodococcus (in: high G+C Gram-positive bacteria)]|uniref:hypothetical protein n=1 Tax=unclassified Rhodococcus (in: high G+C Gram-positive bacteria) TaxID=192944 RepID=UPI0007BB791F|nr:MULTISPECIES: hypothetical protein [unclassified Rhodococcus (in: high G+C Gram-positive bacteria)]KZF00592.1 hypothetical protein A2J02_08575 [Rhodococcus sp. EPR-147]KZF01986.1 hypothetical protein A2J04_09735 [Rhodococcus sp. EPR-279]OZE35955.1 hypothetical protein CH256_08905 [Rhodococcus sp. 05-2254-6]OZF46977.1 hypothetical protein CH291_15895 [Rhodococcus sp. 14-1411-2a]